MVAAASVRTEVGGAESRSGVMIAALVGGHAIKHIYNAGFFALLPDIQAGLGLSNTGVGTLAAARGLAGSASNLPAGFLADRFNRWWAPMLGIAMVFIGVFHFVMGSVASFPAVLLAAVVANAAVAFWHPPAIAALSLRFAHRRGFAISLHGSGGSLGEAAGPLLVGSLLLIMSYQQVLQASLFPAVFTGLMVWWLMRGLRGHAGAGLTVLGYLTSLRRFLLDPALLAIFVATGAYSMCQTAVSTFLPIYLRTTLGYTPLEMGGYLFAAQAAGIASAPLLGFLSDRFGRRAVLVPSLLTLGSAVLVVTLVPGGVPLLGTVLVMGMVQFPMTALFLAAAMDIVGRGVQATMVSLVFGVGTLFGSISPAVAGLLADSFGIQAAFFWAAAIAALAALALVAGPSRASRAAAR